MTARVTYDEVADVLYVQLEDGKFAHGFEDRHGRLWRFTADNKLIGVTYTDFASRLSRGARLNNPVSPDTL